MLFNRPEFLLLFCLTWSIYYLPLVRTWQVPLLICSSLIFYSYHLPILLVLLVISISLNAVSSYQVYYLSDARLKRLWATAGVVLNLTILAFFKYSGLLVQTFSLSGSVGEFLMSIPLPVGISFFTFQGISLVVDVYSGKYDQPNAAPMVHPRPIVHFANSMFFIAFFPQLIAGPIVKAHDFVPQIRTKYWRDIDWEMCFKALLTGYFLKMVVADQLKNHTFWIAYPMFLTRSGTDLLVMLLGYSMQIFADFAGYSLIAIGLAGLFGYTLMPNFDFPYISHTFSEFWRRWHISLSSFLKEYLYFPLGGNRHGQFRTYLNLMIVMFLGGLWHGAAWSYAVWGTAHGLALAVERFISDRVKVRQTLLLKISRGILVFSYMLR